MANLNIQHDPEHARFHAAVEPPDHEVVLQYRTLDEDTLDFRSTLVPPQVRGQGLGAEIVRHALDYARKEDLAIIPSCPFVAAFIERNPEYQEVVAPRDKRPEVS